MKTSRWVVFSLCLVAAACGGGMSPTEPSARAPAPTAIPTATPTATPTPTPPANPTPTPLPHAFVRGFVTTQRLGASVAGIPVHLIQGSSDAVAYSGPTGSYVVDDARITSGPAQIVVNPGQGCLNVIESVQLPAGPLQFDIEICARGAGPSYPTAVPPQPIP